MKFEDFSEINYSFGLSQVDCGVILEVAAKSCHNTSASGISIQNLFCAISQKVKSDTLKLGSVNPNVRISMLVATIAAVN